MRSELGSLLHIIAVYDVRTRKLNAIIVQCIYTVTLALYQVTNTIITLGFLFG